MPRVIGRVDVYNLYFSEIALLQEFQDFKVVTLDIEVLRRVLVDAIFFHRA